ncbi:MULTISPECIES: hypothetical protein [Legionella]|uniref:Uncharacterized protein n=1 Tax=Legionella septentrionalis TaxID=2498109 RepID=A0A433JLL8_9GAMM|nr:MULTISPECIES: hypothetical protein [Legionella]MCP0914610.1 hypothetical protein [Legionella sp. 27cVA30]RUQ90062.1 hypothetical protein EKM59_02705 [Legionella septentrionalis]RUQ96168.1 hypothetical protein ELY11_08515 [Legionella septentrionalis]RUR09354.1 hypothetical protein ELY14_08895 [Legionella septentrionalis]RUR14304.1 hypothetical protein ELY10_09105 [Legionella septentrionalis]
MKYKYLGKVHFEDDHIAKHFANNVDELVRWMHELAQKKFSEITGEIIDNKTHRIVKSIQFNPAED